jgi:hypothetical protein
MGIEDVHWNLRSTDNYVEKYLPIKIQTSITETLISIINNWKILGRLLNYDIKRYKVMHEIILSDSGMPTLNKRGYWIPDPEVIEKKLLAIENDMSVDDDEDIM